MTAPDRRIRHLRLRAGSQADVGRVLPMLEDALRCASLPDTGSRLLLVRRLALGRIARDANAQALAQVIEQRVAAVGGQWVEGGSAAAAGAAYVSFAGALEARMRLALRLLRGEPHAEWYWPLAVPELRAAEGRRDALRRIACAMAQWPEARTALPAWVAALVQAGQGASLAAAIPVSEGEALVRQVMSAAPAGARAHPPGPRAEAAPQEMSQETPGDCLHWMRCLLGALPGQTGGRAAVPVEAPAAAVPPEHRTKATKPAESGAPPLHAPPPHPAPPVSEGLVVPVPEVPRRAPPVLQPVPGRPARLDAMRTGPDPAGLAAPPLAGATQEGVAEAMEREQPARRAPAPPWVARHHPFDARPSAFAGLLFLLPVLQRLGLAPWLAEAPDTRFAQRVLHHGLRRLRAPADDPAWAVATFEPADGPARPGPAPACWSDPLLAAVPSLPLALAACGSADAQAAVWLSAARRWLRRAGRMGLASLVRRPGFIGLTPTHADLHFHLQDTDLRVRRLGLDIDPGWLPWFGRVVTFHFHRALP
jgi:hypothetical protein